MKTTSNHFQSSSHAVNSGRMAVEPASDPDEKIGIVRIRLCLPRCGMTAIVSEFTDADRALVAWKQARRLSDSCDFSILFTDGAAIRGSFGVSDQAKNLLSLPRIVRMALGVCPLARGYVARCVSIDKGGGPLSHAQLDGYALNLHGLHPKSAHVPTQPNMGVGGSR
ncbi:hypothetical protein [Massilia niabensis]|uniref:Uncharacterized protein n=1 Tax=Massilia niabensis TaxID=544910 RepID=A0ABW0L3K5_9BURK